MRRSIRDWMRSVCVSVMIFSSAMVWSPSGNWTTIMALGSSRTGAVSDDRPAGSCFRMSRNRAMRAEARW